MCAHEIFIKPSRRWPGSPHRSNHPSLARVPHDRAFHDEDYILGNVRAQVRNALQRPADRQHINHRVRGFHVLGNLVMGPVEQFLLQLIEAATAIEMGPTVEEPSTLMLPVSFCPWGSAPAATARTNGMIAVIVTSDFIEVLLRIGVVFIQRKRRCQLQAFG